MATLIVSTRQPSRSWIGGRLYANAPSRHRRTIPNMKIGINRLRTARIITFGKNSFLYNYPFRSQPLQLVGSPPSYQASLAENLSSRICINHSRHELAERNRLIFPP